MLSDWSFSKKIYRKVTKVPCPQNNVGQWHKKLTELVNHLRNWQNISCDNVPLNTNIQDILKCMCWVAQEHSLWENTVVGDVAINVEGIFASCISFYEMRQISRKIMGIVGECNHAVADQEIWIFFSSCKCDQWLLLTKYTINTIHWRADGNCFYRLNKRNVDQMREDYITIRLIAICFPPQYLIICFHLFLPRDRRAKGINFQGKQLLSQDIVASLLKGKV